MKKILIHSQNICDPSRPSSDLPGVAVGLAELVPVAAALAPLAPLEAAAPPPGAKAVWLLGKWLLMQPSTHLA
jgi:hypothetical protein